MLIRIGNHHMLLANTLIWNASTKNSVPAKTSIWSKSNPPSSPVFRKSSVKNVMWNAFQMMSIPMRKKKSRRNSIARLKLNRRK